MKCPQCKKASLDNVFLKPSGVELTRCGNCFGYWAAVEKLGLLLGEHVTAKFQVPRYAMRSDNHICPVCDIPLFDFYYPGTETHIDSCKDCGGVWLTQSEINEIDILEKNSAQIICAACGAENTILKDQIDVVSCQSCSRLLKNQEQAINDDLEGSNVNGSGKDSSVLSEVNKDISLTAISSTDKLRSPNTRSTSNLPSAETPSEITVKYEWESVEDADLEFKFCLFALPAMLFVAVLFNVSGLGASLQRIWLTMPIHEFGHALTAWFMGFNAIPSLWVTQVSESRGFVGPLLLAFGIVMFMRYALRHHSLVGLVLCIVLLMAQFIGIFFISHDVAHMLITFGGDGLGLVLATVLMSSFYYGKDTQLYKGALRWGFLAIGAAAFVDIYSVWFNSLSDIGNVPYGTTGGRFTDSYKLVDIHLWSFDTLINRYFMLGNTCLVVLGIVYLLGLKKAQAIKAKR